MSISVHQVRLMPHGKSFDVRPDETILRAAERQGVTIKYGCRHGNCSTCKYYLLEGDVDFGNASPYSLSEREREDGWALLCCATPLGDVVVQDDTRADERALPFLAPTEPSAMVLGAEFLGGDMWRLRLGLDSPLRFYPGQFVELGVPGLEDEWRSYSIASPPAQDRELEFLIKHIDSGAFSGQVPSLEPGTAMRVRGPYGDSYLRRGTDPMLLVGVGSGLAPLMSMLRHAAATKDGRPFTLVYGARTRDGLVLLDELDDLRMQLDLTLLACVSQPTPTCEWNGFHGRVTQAVQRAVGDATGLDAYLCGKPEMCESVQRLLEAKGLEEGRTFSDPFYPALGENSHVAMR
jgi:NAD(P)H-flavin reductase/ferredoxin